MVQQIRVYRGSTELNISDCSITLTNDQVVNSAKITYEAEDTVTAGSVILFKKADGSTNVFQGKVMNRRRTQMWDSLVYTNGFELSNQKVETVYDTGTTPEAIVQDVVENWTVGLTWASTNPSSGITYANRYIAKGYGIDVIKDQMDLLDWQIRISTSNVVYFEPKGYVNNGITLTDGGNCVFTDWDDAVMEEFVNHVEIKGALVTTQADPKAFVASAAQTTFTLAHRPVGTVRVTVDGSVQSGDASSSIYSVDQENSDIIFTIPMVGGEAVDVEYSYLAPVKVDYQDDDSIAAYYEVFQKLDAPWIVSFTDARRYAQEYVNQHDAPGVRTTALIPGMDFDKSVGEVFTCYDARRSKNVQLVCSQIVYKSRENQTVLSLGTRSFVLFDWQRQVFERLQKLERKVIDDDDTAFARSFNHELDIGYTLTNVWEYATPNDSFVLGHTTLSRLRATLATEADCSDNAHNGTWNGTNVTTGAQFTTSGWRLSAGTLNGTDHYVTTADHADLDLSGDFTISIAVKVASLPGATRYLLQKWDATDGYAIRINSSNKVELAYASGGSVSTLACATALTTNTWQHLTFVKSSTSLTVYLNGTSNATGSGGATVGTNALALEVGRYSGTYTAATIDEVRVYNDAKSSTTASLIYSKVQVMENLKLYWSFDNPRLGDRWGSRTTV